jgi:hypothetical protein
MQLPVRWSETLEHDVKNERAPERSTFPSCLFTEVAECHLIRIVQVERMAKHLFRRIQRLGERRMSEPFALYAFVRGSSSRSRRPPHAVASR